jgi:spermidine/putrescine transport system permease protein
MNDNYFKKIAILIPAVWLVLFALLPFLLVFFASFFSAGQDQLISFHVTLNNYRDIFNATYFHIFIRSFYLAGITTLLCLLLGYPFAFIISRFPAHVRPGLIFLVIIPFWTSSLIRLYSTIILIRGQGLISHFLLWAHIIQQPVDLLYTQTAVLIGLVYALLPFMILPLFANMEKFDWFLVDAAKDLGANRWQIMRKIVFPLTRPGIIAGVILVLLPAMTMFYIPDILGGAKSLLLGNLIKNQFIEARNWPLGSAASVVLTLIMGVMIAIYWKSTTKKERHKLI